jgi:hypothetical protein
MCLFRLAICYFHLGKLLSAIDLIATSVKINGSNHKTMLWKGVICFYHIHNFRFESNKSKKQLNANKQEEALKFITQCVKGCEESLLKVSEFP